MKRLFAKIKRETLNQDEKLKIFSNLQVFVSEHPAQTMGMTFYNSWFTSREKTFFTSVAAIMLAFILIDSTTFAATNSLPGDNLYPVKMLSEKVELLTALGSKAKASVEASHAISRLDEVERMVAASGGFDEKVCEEMEEKFEKHAKNTIDNIEKLKNGGSEIEANIILLNFKKSLNEHENIITELSKSKNTKAKTKEDLSHIMAKVHSKLRDKND